jgi:hypothetical protein
VSAWQIPDPEYKSQCPFWLRPILYSVLLGHTQPVTNPPDFTLSEYFHFCSHHYEHTFLEIQIKCIYGIFLNYWSSSLVKERKWGLENIYINQSFGC